MRPSGSAVCSDDGRSGASWLAANFGDESYWGMGRLSLQARIHHHAHIHWFPLASRNEAHASVAVVLGELDKF